MRLRRTDRVSWTTVRLPWRKSVREAVWRTELYRFYRSSRKYLDIQLWLSNDLRLSLRKERENEENRNGRG